MKRFLFCLLLFPASVHAEDAIIFAECQSGGCICRVSPISASEIAVITGQPTPADAAAQTLVLHEGAFIWSKTPRDDLDLAMGGDGVCEIEAVAPIIPEDGTWTGTVDVTGISGCHPQVAAMVPPIAESMSQTRRILWGGTFHPEKLAKGGKSPAVKWSQVRSDHFTGTVPMKPNGVIDISVNATATLTAPDQAKATLSIRFDPVGSESTGSLALIGMNGCEAKAEYAFRRTGP